ncbi:hypothetical protein VNI00_017097 [Paramarasmius palmivorus]|uniref:Uncharacterized protein n=1 Tax=Paramarasmius palmivorus TaxID=297713 RepID=A0AAW0B8C9_9AGAR
MPTSSTSNNRRDDWDFAKVIDAIQCVVTVPPTKVDFVCTPKLYQGKQAVPLKPKGKNFYVFLDPRQDGSGYIGTIVRLPSSSPIKNLEHHKCATWALEQAKRDAELACPRLLIVELSKLFPGIMSSVPVTLNGQMQFPNPNSQGNNTSGSLEVSASPNLLCSPPSTPSRLRATSVTPMSPSSSAPEDPPAYQTTETNGDWGLYVVNDSGVAPFDGLRRAYRGLRAQLRLGTAALLLALSEEAADDWFNPSD